MIPLTAFSNSQNLKYSLWLLRSKQRKYLSRWWESLTPGYLLSMPYPWMAFGAVDFISMHIQPGWKVFEWGSGGSTLFWLSRGADVVSIEHDREWHQIVQKKLPPSAAVDYRLIHAEPSSGEDDHFDPSDPARFQTNHPPLRDFTLNQYVRQIDEFPENHFDMIVVDGRARPSCLAHAVCRLKDDGLLVLDNADRDYYLRQTRPLLSNLERNRFVSATPTICSDTTTDVYRKGR